MQVKALLAAVAALAIAIGFAVPAPTQDAGEPRSRIPFLEPGRS